ncbi:helix-turn-helix domain-containing protein [Succinivibrio dextrinosolvens]|uniref:helix-turn-helix domain-containing protein n=1 Tax=Succinivibrio dextrinosolvens TaxID=83771 RepID=UPI0006920A62|nr:helix-turn-helix domain-containing protein [Succinivibrio dextrinosolvens]
MNKAIGQKWEEVEKELFTPEEIAESDLRVAVIGEQIKARNEKGLSQRELSSLSGIAPNVITRIKI